MGNSIEGILYIVSTPIGNLSDLTFRALEVLKNVDIIAAEDTRTTAILLSKYKIETKLTSYHKFSENKKTPELIQKLKEGLNIALVSDAGTPLISDPGNIIVKEAAQNGIKIVPVGGISAVTTFLSSISREGEDFKFIGFLPRTKSEIEKVLIKNRFENLVFYESPERIKETFGIINEINPETLFSIGRELTKKFEEIKTAKIKDIIDFYEKNPIKGEIVCMVHKNKSSKEDEEKLKEKVKALKNEGFTSKDCAKILDITDMANKNKVKDFYFEE